MPHLTHGQIATRWAKRDRAESLKGHHIFCDRDTIYSYGYHFPIARWHDKRTVFFNADSYSKSTGRHKSIVRWTLRRNCPDVTVFTLPRAFWGNSDYALSTIFYKDKIQTAVGKWQRARVHKNHHMRDAHHYLQEFKTYCAFHKLSATLILKGDGVLAAAVAVIALNPVPETEY